MAQEQPGYPVDQIVCPNCAGNNPAGASFCAHCGQPTVAQRRFCANCGYELLGDAQFCPSCGTAAVQARQTGGPPQQVLQPSGPPRQVQPPGAVYGAPASQGLPASIGLAGRGSRLGGAIIDGLIGVVPYIILVAVDPIIGALLLIGVVILQMVLLTKYGQSLGKKAVGTRIVKVDTGQNGGFVPNVLLRFILNGLLGLIPFYGIVDALFIFREDRRCIHDFIAGTHVIEA